MDRIEFTFMVESGTRTKSIVALLGDVVLLLHNQLQLALPLNVGVLTVLDHVVDRPARAKWRNC